MELTVGPEVISASSRDIICPPREEERSLTTAPRLASSTLTVTFMTSSISAEPCFSAVDFKAAFIARRAAEERA